MPSRATAAMTKIGTMRRTGEMPVAGTAVVSSWTRNPAMAV
jgi:hypothetical protein